MSEPFLPKGHFEYREEDEYQYRTDSPTLEPLETMDYDDIYENHSSQTRYEEEPSYIQRSQQVRAEQVDPKYGSMHQGRWDPTSFGRNYLFDEESKVPRSRQECEENFKKISKRNIPIDYYGYLEEAEKYFERDNFKYKMCLAMAFNTQMLNTLLNKSPSTNEQFDSGATVVPNQGFSLDRAKVSEMPVVLPGGRYFIMSDFVTPEMASNYSSSFFDTDGKSLLRNVLKQVSTKDPYFAAYTAPATSNSGYTPIGQKFYEAIYKFVSSGFGQEENDTLKSKIFRMTREVLTNLLDRVRCNSKDSPREIAVNLRENLKRVGENFRRGKLEIHSNAAQNGFQGAETITSPKTAATSENSSTPTYSGSFSLKSTKKSPSSTTEVKLLVPTPITSTHQLPRAMLINRHPNSTRRMECTSPAANKSLIRKKHDVELTTRNTAVVKGKPSPSTSAHSQAHDNPQDNYNPHCSDSKPIVRKRPKK